MLVPSEKNPLGISIGFMDSSGRNSDSGPAVTRSANPTMHPCMMMPCKGIFRAVQDSSTQQTQHWMRVFNTRFRTLILNVQHRISYESQHVIMRTGIWIDNRHK